MAEGSAARGEIVSVKDSDDHKMQLATVKLFTGEELTDVELAHPYGFASHPVEGAEVFVVFMDGSRSHPVVMLAPDRRHRLTGLKPGESALWDKFGNYTLHSADGIKTKTAGVFEIEAASIVMKSGDIKLGGEGANKPVGVQGTTDSAGHPLTSNFSSSVKTT